MSTRATTGDETRHVTVYSTSDAWLALGVFAAGFAVVAATLSDYGFIWDEPYYFSWQDRLLEWFSEFHNDPTGALQAERIEWGWNADADHNPHPPFYKFVALVCGELARDFMDVLSARRLASAGFFAATGSALFLLVRRSGGQGEALLAAALFATCPRIFAHAHFAATETPMGFFAVSTLLVFLASGERHWLRRSVALGALLGAALATKFTALLLPVPLVLWVLRHRRWDAIRGLAIAAVVMLAVALLLVPPWWHDPVEGVRSWIEVSSSRSQQVPIPILHFGEYHRFSAPWTQPWTLLALATPLPFFVPALASAAFLLARRLQDRERSALLLAALVPIGVASLPIAPNHDGIRLFLPALPFVAALSARGWVLLATWLGAQLERSVPEARRVAFAGAAIAALGPQIVATAQHHPLQLSYHNLLVGGARGAADQGLEVTYWMDALTPEVVRELEDALPPDAQVNVVAMNLFYFEYLKRLGRLRPDIDYRKDWSSEYALVLSRYSLLPPDAKAALASQPVVYESSRFGVPLVRLFHRAGPSP